jgi:hypothetical protein
MEKLAAARTNQFMNCSSVQVVVINHRHWGEGNLNIYQLKIVCARMVHLKLVDPAEVKLQLCLIFL